MPRKLVYPAAAVEFIPKGGEMYEKDGRSVKAKAPMCRIYADVSRQDGFHDSKLLSLKNAIILAEQSKRVFEIEKLNESNAETERAAVETDATITSDAIQALLDLGMPKKEVLAIVRKKISA